MRRLFGVILAFGREVSKLRHYKNPLETVRMQKGLQLETIAGGVQGILLEVRDDVKLRATHLIEGNISLKSTQT